MEWRVSFASNGNGDLVENYLIDINIYSIIILAYFVEVILLFLCAKAL